MKSNEVILGVSLLVLVVSDLVCGQSCFTGQAQLNNLVNTTNVSGGYYTLTGYATVCVSGSYVPVCNDSSLTPLEAELICITAQTLLSGYFGTPDDSIMLSPFGNTNTVVTDYYCSSVINCNYTVSVGGCPNGYAVLSCQSSVCDESTYSTRLFNNYTTMVDGTTAVTGIPQSCLNGNYFRFCNKPGTSPGAYVVSACINAGYSYGRALPSNSSLRSGSPNGIGYVGCTGSNCASVGVSSDHQCYTGEYDLVVQCYQPRPCQGSGLSFYNSTTTYGNGREMVTGVVTNCLFNYTAVLCNRQPVSPFTVRFTCSLLGFQDGSIVPPNPSLYGTAPIGSVYYTNYTCPSNATSADDCYATPVMTDSECYNGQHDIILQCYRPAPTTLAPTMMTNTVSASNMIIASSATASSTATPSVSTSSDNVRLIAGVAVGVVVFILLIIISVIVILLFVYLVKTGSRGPFKKKEPVELYKFSDVKRP